MSHPPLDTAFQDIQPKITDSPPRPQKLVSVSCPCAQLDPMAVFQYGLGHERFFWADSQQGIAYVGLGIAADLQAWGPERFRTITEKVSTLFADAHLANTPLTNTPLTNTESYSEPLPAFVEPRLFGGFAFGSDFTPDNTWSIYHPAQFVLPHYQLSVQNHAHAHTPPDVWLTLNTLVDWDEDAKTVAEQLKEALAAQAAILQKNAVRQREEHPSATSIKYPMSTGQWSRLLGAALDEFAAERLQKVVLSRVCEIRFDRHVDVDGALTFLNATYPDCTRFVFEPRAHHAFFGASPEILVHLEGQTLTTMGLAGSAPRGKTAEEDHVLGQGLLDSAKDQHEHQLVVDAIRQRLEPICTDLAMPDAPALLKLSNIQHLFTPIGGTLSDAQTIFDLVELLHPTPALGGAPRSDALAFINQQEPVPRGWYAAPMGIVDRHLEGTFSVAIRSAVTEYERVWLHAGAGIVAASDPQMEWDETALKFRPILNALGIQGEVL